MRPDPCWPQWLSVPAAPGPTWTAQGVAPRARLLELIADHGVARARTIVGGGHSSAPCRQASPRHVPRQDLSSVSNEVRVEMPGSDDGCVLVNRSLIDLGRHDGTRVEPVAQRFDLGPGTFDSRLGAAMDSHQLDLALSAGRHAVERAKLDGVALIQAHGDGEGAITTNQVWRGLLRRWPEALMQPELLSETQAIAAEATIADAGLILMRHAIGLFDPYEALRRLGGFEHAALVGSALAAAQLGMRWMAVGESAEIARLLALNLNPSVGPWLQAASVLPSFSDDSCLA